MKKIALFAKPPHCSLDGCNGLINSLYPNYTFKLFNEHFIEPGFFDDIDMICFPGGIGDADKFYRFFRDESKIKLVQDYIKQGGRYLGICMGAYWAEKDYFDILDGVTARQYITQPKTDTRRPHPKSIKITWLGQPREMYFYDGCALVGDETKFKTVARYANGDPMAIIQNKIGIIGCHPEADAYWYDNPKYMQKHFKDLSNQKLLKDFVDHLMSL